MRNACVKGNQLKWQSTRLACGKYRDRYPDSPMTVAALLCFFFFCFFFSFFIFTLFLLRGCVAARCGSSLYPQFDQFTKGLGFKSHLGLGFLRVYVFPRIYIISCCGCNCSVSLKLLSKVLKALPLPESSARLCCLTSLYPQCCLLQVIFCKIIKRTLVHVQYKALQSAFDKAREKQTRQGVEHPHSNQTHHHENNARNSRIFTSNVVLLFNFFNFFAVVFFLVFFTILLFVIGLPQKPKQIFLS